MAWQENAKRLMKERGILQRDLVPILRVKEKQVGHYFTGRNDITLGRFLALAKHLGVQPHELLDVEIPSIEALQKELQSVPLRALPHVQAMLGAFKMAAHLSQLD